MSSIGFLLTSVAVALTLAFCFGTADAIQCYTCSDTASTCQSYASMTTCPSTAQFCLLQYTGSSGMASQSCASTMDCPTGTRRRRQAATSSNSNAADILNCCNYDGCNCIGTQCVTVVSGAANHESASSVIATIATIMAALLA